MIVNIYLEWENRKFKKAVFDVHVTVHRDKFLKIKPTRCTDFSYLFLEWNSTCFGQFLCTSSGVLFTVHTAMVYVIQVCWQLASRLLASCMTYTIAVSTVKNSLWWTEELSEICRVSFQEKIWEISASSWFYYTNFKKGDKYVKRHKIQRSGTMFVSINCLTHLCKIFPSIFFSCMPFDHLFIWQQFCNIIFYTENS